MDTSTYSYGSSLIINSGKFKIIEDLIYKIDLIGEVLREDIERICKARKFYFSDFEASFKVGLSQTKLTLTKKNLKAVKKFYSCKNLKKALEWLQSRILNNMRLAANLKHKFAFEAPKFGAFEDYNISKYYDIDTEIEIENLQKMNKNELIKGLRRVWEEDKYDEDFDLQDLKDLCLKFDISLYDVISKKELELPNIGNFKLGNGKKQTFLIFD